MSIYGMGEAIREMRLRLGYTQEELAYGICTPGTLSRIENGRAAISKQVFESLCSRIPNLHHAWISCDTKKEMQRSKLCKQILRYLELRKLTEAEEAMEQYSRLKDDKNPFCLQFECYTRAIYQAILNEREEKILNQLKKALEFTMPCYEERFKRQRKTVILSYDEIFILLNMGIAYTKLKKIEISFPLFYYLKEYLEMQNLDLAEAAKTGPMIYGNLAWLLENQRRYEEAARQCDNGIKICCFSGKYTVLPHLLCIKARCAAASNDQRAAEKSARQANAILSIEDEYRGYGSFREFYKAMEPIFVTY